MKMKGEVEHELAKTQIVVVHGGSAFDSYEDYIKSLRNMEVSLEYLKKKGWKDTLQEHLGDEYDVVKPYMPNRMNAKYTEWQIYFERFIPLFNDEVVLVGHSLGGIFLAKYLAENDYPKRIGALFLIAAPFDGRGSAESLGDFILPEDIENISQQCDTVFLYYSEDDVVVTLEDTLQYAERFPNVTTVALKDRGHINQPDFPEIVERIKSLQ